MADDKSKKVRLILRDWLPNQHGAWFIVIVPLLFGAGLSGWCWEHALLGAVWVIGFFFVFAGLRWVKNPRRKAWRTPTIVYGVLATLLGIWTLVVLPRLAFWIPLFALIMGVWGWEVSHGRERGVPARFTIIVASGLVTLVAYHCGLMSAALRMGQEASFGVREAQVLGGHAFSSVLRGWSAAVMVACELTAYFMGAVPYVKTIFRQRGNKRFLIASGVMHVVFLLLAVGSACLRWVSPLVAVAWLVALFRALWFPWKAKRRGKPWAPRVIGRSEVALSLLVFLAAVL